MLYNHLRGKGFVETQLGPVIWSSNIIVEIQANKDDYKLEENSPVERQFAAGLRVTEPGAIVSQTKTNAAGDIHNSAYFILRVDTDVVIGKLYLHQILRDNNNGRPFYLLLPGRINLSESSLIIPKNDTIAADTVIEFQVEYAKLKK